jgi:hypothetical protein
MSDYTQRVSPSALRLSPSHRRISSRSPTRNRLTVTVDILDGLSPASTLEAFTNPSGRLKASIEAATAADRAFGIRAAIASKNIQEWVDELEDWQWPAEGGSLGFENPRAKRRKLSNPSSNGYFQNGNDKVEAEEPQYIGSLLAPTALEYDARVIAIANEMDDLNVEDIKRQVLETHFSSRSRPSSSASNATTTLLSSYTRMDDFTAIVTATVLKALPNLSRLMRLMDTWSVRLNVLRKVPRLLGRLQEGEAALKSGWAAIHIPAQTHARNTRDGHASEHIEEEFLTWETFQIMRDVLQNQVTKLGQDLDYMLDTLEGREDTLPEIWLDRMEAIEHDYGEWVVAADRKVREGEWAKLVKARKEREEAERLKREEEEAAEAARLQAEKEREEAEAEAERLEAQKEREEAEAEAARLKALKYAQEAEAAAISRLQELKKAEEAEAARLKAEKEREEAKAEAAHLKAIKDAQEAKAAEFARQQALKEEEEAEAARVNAEKEKEETEVEAARLKAIQDAEEAEALEFARQKTTKEAEDAEAARLEAEKDAQEAEAAEALRLKAEKDAREAEAARQKAEQDEEEAAAPEGTKKQAIRELEEAEAAEIARRKAKMEAQDSENEAARLEGAREAQEGEVAEIATRKATEEAEVENASLLSRQLSADASPEAAKRESIANADTETTATPECEQCVEADTGDQPKISSTGLLPAIVMNADAGLSKTASPNGTRPSEPVDLQAAGSNFEPLRDIFSFDGVNESKIDANEFHLQTLESPSRRTSKNFDLQPEDQNSYFYIPPAVLPMSRPQVDTAGMQSRPTSSKSTALYQPEKDCMLESPARTHNLNSSRRSPPTRPSNQGHTSSPRRTIGMIEGTFIPHDIALSVSAPSSPVKVKSIKEKLGVSGPSSHTASKVPTEEEWIVFDSAEDEATHDAQNQISELSEAEDNDALHPNGQNRNNSLLSGYSTSDPTPEIQEAEPAEYFRPVLSPVKSPRSSTLYNEPPKPKSPLSVSGMMTVVEVPPTLDDLGAPSAFPPPSNSQPDERQNAFIPRIAEEEPEKTPHTSSGDGASESLPEREPELDMKDFNPPTLARKASITRINSGVRRISISRRESVSSTTSTITTSRQEDAPSSPVAASPASERDALDAFQEDDEPSPSIRRIGRLGRSNEYTSPDSPPPIPPMSPRRSLYHRGSISSVSDTPDILSTPLDTPFLDNVDVSSAPFTSSPKRASSDDQMRQQISSLLESIPARIRLTSEPPEINPPETLNVKKTRRSITPSYRPSSSLSTYSSYSRAPTPSFTLAPAYGKGTSRPRPQNGNPEIKLYHLSRSTGEAPIKLFVRLVGENGERVMVRVGGGWADLGEYLKEYASHHGRRTKVDDDKVEIQDLPPRIVSTSSTASSSATIRGNGRVSPAPRPVSAFDRPMSSLNVRKTRKSAGNELEAPSRGVNDIRSPSTPLPSINHRQFETPPSAASTSTSGTGERSASRMEWTDEDSSLGLAGPKSKKVAISERDQEWVESMKEKVKKASAEKERKNRERGTSFGELDKIGGTKRLFRKGGL